ncbi:MAG: hypothetical protein UHH95_03720 [Oscillospiraceae bacterium]|nr:hypothetical protein [Oscillospiraceae bacterium]
MAAETQTFSKIVDESTIDGWKTYFDPQKKDTTYAGGVWTDKSVFTNAEAFPESVREQLKIDNSDTGFLVSLSAIAANKEIVGYATIPTDTVLVLDVSGSMQEERSELVLATNLAIDKLLKENNNNRVGVVLYSGNSQFGASNYTPQGTVTLLPINRYTASNTENVKVGNNNVTVPKYVDLDGNTVKVDSGISPSIANAKTKDVVGGTYIQAGLFEAYQLFNNADTTIGQDNFQSGQSRMPILVLMSDGAPTSATTDYANIGDANVGNGSSTYCATNSTAFLTRLTASYVFNRIKAKYKAPADTEGKGFFYTLGFGSDFSGAGTPSYKLYDAATDVEVTDGATFVNDYNPPTEAVVVFSGKKEIDGNRVQNAGEFEFNLYKTESDFDITGITPEKQTNASDGGFLFAPITLEGLSEGDKAYFVVTETKGTIGGIVYDETVYQMPVCSSCLRRSRFSYCPKKRKGNRIISK